MLDDLVVELVVLDVSVAIHIQSVENLLLPGFRVALEVVVLSRGDRSHLQGRIVDTTVG